MEPINESKKVGEEMMNLNQMMKGDSPSHCGYCDKNGSYSCGLVKDQMHPYTYQLMAERGWRRCGTYYYKPNIQKSCCKLWTHRQDVNKFRIKKDQRKTIRKMMKLAYQSAPEAKPQQRPKEAAKVAKTQKMEIQIPKDHLLAMEKSIKILLSLIAEKRKQFIEMFEKGLIDHAKTDCFALDPILERTKFFISQPNAKADYYTNFIMLLFGSNKKLFKKQYKNTDFASDVQKYVEGLAEANPEISELFAVQVERSGYLLFALKAKKQEKVETVHTQKQPIKEKTKKKPEQKNEQMDEQDHHQKYKGQFSIKSDEIWFGALVIRLVPAEADNETWKLYQEYCQAIHNKPQKSKSSYKGFLCEKALTYLQEKTSKQCSEKYLTCWDPEGLQQKAADVQGERVKHLGCYHMKYYLRGQLIGVGVVDLLPDGLSSVYFFYHPRFKDMRLGVFSSLIQIEYIRWMKLSFPEFKNYYMGFYIQNNHKMSYKGDYEPFDLLCPVSFRFVECNAEMRQLIDKIEKKEKQSAQLANTDVKIDDMNFTTDIGLYIIQNLKIMHQGKRFGLNDFNPRIVAVILDLLKHFIQLWGKELFNIFTFTF